MTARDNTSKHWIAKRHDEAENGSSSNGANHAARYNSGWNPGLSCHSKFFMKGEHHENRDPWFG
jgi:hypothetical protein